LQEFVGNDDVGFTTIVSIDEEPEYFLVFDRDDSHAQVLSQFFYPMLWCEAKWFKAPTVTVAGYDRVMENIGR